MGSFLDHSESIRFHFDCCDLTNASPCSNVHQFLIFIEGDVGQELKIGNEKFHDLDQILGQYVEQLRVNLQEVFAFEVSR